MTSSFAEATVLMSEGLGPKVWASPFLGTMLVVETRSPPTFETISASTVVVVTTWSLPSDTAAPVLPTQPAAIAAIARSEPNRRPNLTNDASEDSARPGTVRRSRPTRLEPYQL